MWRNRSVPRRTYLLCALAGLLATGNGRADDISDLKARLEAQEKQIQELRKIIEETRKAGGRVVAVGTTSMRVLESVAGFYDGRVWPYRGSTRLFITPGYRFRVVDAMITNFHLPRSTLLLLVSAFAGKALIEKAYQEAIHEHYRFFSFGDAMLIW